MPYKTAERLPKSVRDALPAPAQHIYMEVYNHAWQEYEKPSKRRGNESRQETAAKVAWSAVKKQYEKNEKSGKWKRR